MSVSEKANQFDKSGQILTYLAKNRPSTKYGIERGLRGPLFSPIDHATLYKLISILKETGSIYVVKTGTSRVGLRMEYYDLTVFGLIGAIQHDYERKKTNPEEPYVLNLRMLADKYGSHLPLVFGKWQFFHDKGWKPDEWLRESSYRFVNWKKWMPFREHIGRVTDTNSHELQLEEWQADFLRLTLLHRYGHDWSLSKNLRKQVSTWDDVMRDGLYLAFFKIRNIEEPMWIQPCMIKQRFFAQKEARVSELDKIWAEDREIRGWITASLTRFADMYFERARWFEKRKKQLESFRKRALRQGRHKIA